MTTITAPTSQASPSAASAAAAGGMVADSQQTEDRFLKLLVAQMRNQDPLNPVDNAQFTSQLAQINTVRGIEQLNESMGKLVERLGGSRALDGIGLIGKTALVAADRVERTEGAGPSRIGFEVPRGADRVKFEILDAGGQVVHSRAFTAVPAGAQAFEWNGTSSTGGVLPAGTYRLRVSADSGGRPADVSTLAAQAVVGVAPAPDGSTRIQLAGGRTVAAGDVRGVF